MFLGDDVIDFEQQFAVLLLKLAVFTTVPSAVPNKVPQFFVHEIKCRGRVF
jgi:hypothetical protein